MNQQRRKTLAAIFAHLLNHNLAPKAVKNVLLKLGAAAPHSGHGAAMVALGGQKGRCHFDAHEPVADDKVKLRQLLKAAGWTRWPMGRPTPASVRRRFYAPPAGALLPLSRAYPARPAGRSRPVGLPAPLNSPDAPIIEFCWELHQ